MHKSQTSGRSGRSQHGGRWANAGWTYSPGRVGSERRSRVLGGRTGISQFLGYWVGSSQVLRAGNRGETIPITLTQAERGEGGSSLRENPSWKLGPRGSSQGVPGPREGPYVGSSQS